ncbi:hypothetical protein MBSD_n1106 [Mizugakiibacter sediminis]|uniref:DUF1232 domain-containing protein n=1 Tax=Mizugakiibacter sediminis TaxID=1475481 RepID=A0A0K8QLK1_9GAMM|nr:YkvA family protein [Mizugakiibacter sediminis]GAP65815.1 hypothetical protein MBSD_n1106 [Mizugakiibacter sediminis]
MRITIELEDSDIRRFHEALARAHRLVACADETEILAAAKHALDHLPIACAPSYVRKRMVEVQRLIVMLEDEAWALPPPEREDVVRTLVYFSDPEDMIPDEVEVIGLLDDAIMLELLLRRLRHVIGAYGSFCAFRASLGPPPQDAAGRIAYARRLSRRREALQRRMRLRGATAAPARARGTAQARRASSR